MTDDRFWEYVDYYECGGYSNKTDLFFDLLEENKGDVCETIADYELITMESNE